MRVLLKEESYIIRKEYIYRFIDVKSYYYINNIQKMTEFKDGLRYTGYLWDCFKNVNIISREECEDLLKNKIFYVFWDLHSTERIFIKNYWKYPLESMLIMNYNEFLEIEKELPKDLYLFDETYTWSVAFTHEEDLVGKRIFYYTEGSE